MIHTFEKVNHVKIPYRITERRAGDIAECYSNPSKAREELGFTCQYTFEDMEYDAYQAYIKTRGEEA